MKFSTAISFLIILPTIVNGGVVRVRLEEDGSDVKLSVQGRFDPTTCLSTVTQPNLDATADVVFFDSAELTVITDDPDFTNVMVCEAVSVVCPLLAADSPSSTGTAYPLVDITGLQTFYVLIGNLVVGAGFPGDISLQLGLDYVPGDLLAGEATITGETLATMGLDTFNGEACTIRLSDPGLFKTPQRIEIHVGSCDFFCSIYWTIYDFLGGLLRFTYFV